MKVERIGHGGQINNDYTRRDETVSNKVNATVTSEEKKNSEVQKYGQDAPSQKEIQKAVDKINKFLEDEKVHAEYEIHEKLNEVMIKIVNDDTKEVVLEIPSKKILDMVAKMLEDVGILVDEKA